jgi:2-aminobenzoate-CoA ligase
MGKIPSDYLPPKELWAEYTSPAEFPVPDKLNLADFLLDRHVKEGRGDNVAILFGDTKMTYKEVWPWPTNSPMSSRAWASSPRTGWASA